MEEYYDVTLCDGRSGEAVLKGGKWTLNDEEISTDDISEIFFYLFKYSPDTCSRICEKQ